MSAELVHLFIGLALGCLLAALACVLADGVELVHRCRVCGESDDLDGTDVCASCYAGAWGVR